MYKKLVIGATFLALCVVVLGAYVRLSDAGLGCPDWPGCYGKLVGVPQAAHETTAAAQAFPGKPVEAGKAWKEMIHRYFAGALGLLVAAIAVMAWRQRRQLKQSPLLPTFLVGLVGLQAALGMWTVTLLLKPAIVTAHLIGGMLTLSCLVWLAMRQSVATSIAVSSPAERIRPWAQLALAVVLCQVVLGGWVSTNYAALACLDFPQCQGSWLPPMDFNHATQIHRELGETASGAILPVEALTAIQWMHRVGALVTFLLVGGLAFSVTRHGELRSHGVALLLLLLAQVSLGMLNVWLRLPLPIAVAHNAGAALLLATLVALNFRLKAVPPFNRR